MSTPTSFRFSPHTAAQLRALCAAMGLERQQVVSMAIDRMAVAVLGSWQLTQAEPTVSGWTPGEPLGIHPEP